MERWRQVAAYPTWVVFWRGQDSPGKEYRLTAERERRLRRLLGDAIEPALPGQLWMWSWSDWDWEGIAGGWNEQE